MGTRDERSWMEPRGQSESEMPVQLPLKPGAWLEQEGLSDRIPGPLWRAGREGGGSSLSLLWRCKAAF